MVWRFIRHIPLKARGFTISTSKPRYAATGRITFEAGRERFFRFFRRRLARDDEIMPELIDQAEDAEITFGHEHASPNIAQPLDRKSQLCRLPFTLKSTGEGTQRMRMLSSLPMHFHDTGLMRQAGR